MQPSLGRSLLALVTAAALTAASPVDAGGLYIWEFGHPAQGASGAGAGAGRFAAANNREALSMSTTSSSGACADPKRRMPRASPAARSNRKWSCPKNELRTSPRRRRWWRFRRTARPCNPGRTICCDAACDTTCEACLASKTNGTDGVCGYIPSGDDPVRQRRNSQPFTFLFES
mgnify:CR=1 FL=1